MNMNGGIISVKLPDKIIQELEYSVLESTMSKEEYIKLEKLGKINFNNKILKGENSHSLAEAIIKNLKESGTL